MSCCNRTSRCALAGWLLCSATLLVVAIVVLTVCFVGQGSKPPTPCHGTWGPYIYLHRGNLNLAQENTATSVVTGILDGVWSEMDILATSDGTPHLFHDKNALRMTGVDRAFADISSSDLADGSIENQAVIDGYDYGQTALIPTAESVLAEICALDPSAPMDLDVKDAASALKMASVLVSSGCDVGDPSSGVIMDFGDPFIARDYRAAEGDIPPIRLSLFLHPGSYGPLGLYFFLKTRFLHWYAGVDIISAHFTVWDRDYDLIRQYEEDGYCSAVYGIANLEEALAKYPSASYFCVDEGPYFPANRNGQFGGDGNEEEILYNGSRGGYIGLVTVGFLSLFMCLASLWMAYRNRSYCCCSQKCCAKESGKDNSNANNDDQQQIDIEETMNCSFR